MLVFQEHPDEAFITLDAELKQFEYRKEEGLAQYSANSISSSLNCPGPFVSIISLAGENVPQMIWQPVHSRSLNRENLVLSRRLSRRSRDTTSPAMQRADISSKLQCRMYMDPM